MAREDRDPANCWSNTANSSRSCVAAPVCTSLLSTLYCGNRINEQINNFYLNKQTNCSSSWANWDGCMGTRWWWGKVQDVFGSGLGLGNMLIYTPFIVDLCYRMFFLFYHGIVNILLFKLMLTSKYEVRFHTKLFLKYFSECQLKLPLQFDTVSHVPLPRSPIGWTSTGLSNMWLSRTKQILGYIEIEKVLSNMAILSFSISQEDPQYVTDLSVVSVSIQQNEPWVSGWGNKVFIRFPHSKGIKTPAIRWILRTQTKTRNHIGQYEVWVYFSSLGPELSKLVDHQNVLVLLSSGVLTVSLEQKVCLIFANLLCVTCHSPFSGCLWWHRFLLQLSYSMSTSTRVSNTYRVEVWPSQVNSMQQLPLFWSHTVCSLSALCWPNSRMHRRQFFIFQRWLLWHLFYLLVRGALCGLEREVYVHAEPVISYITQ